MTALSWFHALTGGFVLTLAPFSPSQAACVPSPPNLVGWWTAEGSANDSAAQLDGVLVGGAAVASGKVGSAFSFDGTGAHVRIPDSSIWDFGTRDFSIGLWVNLRRVESSMFLFQKSDSGALGFEFDFQMANEGLLFDSLVFAHDGIRAAIVRPWTPQSDRWYHLAVTRVRGAYTLYVDGQALGPSELRSEPVADITGPVLVGSYLREDYYLDGLIDELAVFDRGLAASEIAAIHAAGEEGICPPCAPAPRGITAFWPGGAGASDIVGGHNGTLIAGPGFAPAVVGNGFVFDSDDDRITVPHSAAFNATPHGFTVMFWMRAGKDQPDPFFHATLLETSHGWIDNSGWAFHAFANDVPGSPESLRGKLSFAMGSISAGGNSEFVSVVSQSDVLDGRFHHVAGVWNGTQILVYIDGRLHGAQALTQPLNNNRPLNMGFTWGGGNPKRFYRGVLDEVIILNRAVSAPEIAAINSAGSTGFCEPCVPAPGGLISWWRGEGDGSDAIGANALTIMSGLAYVPGRVGNAYSLDDGSDGGYSATPDLLDYANNFTIAFWSLPQADRVTTSESINGVSGIGGQRYAIYPEHGREDGTKAGVGISVGRNGVSVFEHAANYLPSVLVHDTAITDWTHVAVAYENHVPKLYLNGVLVRTGLASSRALAFPSKTIGFGGTYGPYVGLVDELTLFSRPLAGEEIAALHAAGAQGICPPQCVPPPIGLSGWWSGDSLDNLVAGYPATLVNGATTAPAPDGTAFALDGVDDYVVIPDYPALRPSAITISVRVKTDSLGSEQAILTKELPLQNWVSYMLRIYSNGEVNLAIENLAQRRGAYWTTIGRVTAGSWHHIVATWQNTAGDATDCTIYFDGVAQPTTTIFEAYGPDFALNYSDGPLYIGRFSESVGTPFKGLIDEVMIFDRVLPSKEVAGLYGAGATGVCKPQCAPWPTGLVAWWPGDGHAAESVNGFHGTVAGGTTFSMGRQAQAFTLNSTGAGVLVGRPAALDVQNFTIHAWVKRSTTSLISPDGQAIFAYGEGGYGLGMRDDGSIFLTEIGFSYADTPPVITDTDWHHVAVTKAGALVNFFVDGELFSFSSYNPTFAFSTPAAIGARGDNLTASFVGAIDEIAIYNRALGPAEIFAVYSGGLCKPDCLPLLPGITSWWPGDGHPSDLVGINHGTLQNGAIFNGGLIGQAFQFDGIDDSVVIARRAEAACDFHHYVLGEGQFVHSRGLHSCVLPGRIRVSVCGAADRVLHGHQSQCFRLLRRMDGWS